MAVTPATAIVSAGASAALEPKAAISKTHPASNDQLTKGT
jgi:hypothetical protein